ncbi:MAG: carbonic anhydrase family protein [Xanthobacteraceae bacterium]
MDRRRALGLFAGLALCPLCARKSLAAEGHHWGYEGAGGPARWGDLDKANQACSIGAQQSPIDIEETIRAELPALRINWAGALETIVNNGHTIQLNAAPGSTLKLGDVEYKLLQFHFHRPSEHLINGKSFPMEVHFVHQNAAGGLAVVGVLMATGGANAAFNKVVGTMPKQAGSTAKADAAINPNEFLPPTLTYYRYPGSLTTPPCSETVEWLLLTESVKVGDADIAAFAGLYAMNARPAQKNNRRAVLRSG